MPDEVYDRDQVSKGDVRTLVFFEPGDEETS